MSVKNFLYNDVLAVVTLASNISSGITQTITGLTIAANTSAVAFSGEKVKLVVLGSDTVYDLTLTADIQSTTLRFSSIQINDDIPVGSFVMLDRQTKYDKLNQKLINFHQSIFANATSSTNGNDYLSAFGNATFNVNASAVLADGNSKPNRWASQFSIYVASQACTLTNIKGFASSNAATSDNAKIKIFKTNPNEGATGNLTISLLNTFELTSQNNQNYIFDLEATDEHSLVEGDCIFCSIQRFGEITSTSTKWYADLTFEAITNR